MAVNKKPVGVHGTDKETGRTRGSDKPVKTKKPDISREEFDLKAKAVNLGEVFANKFADAKVFKKESYGFFLNDKVTIVIDGTPVKCQANILITVVNSKPEEASEKSSEE